MQTINNNMAKSILVFIYRHIYDSIEKLIMADLLGFGSQAQKWVTDILVPHLKHIENKQDATLEEVTQLRNDLDLHTRMATVERQVQHLKKVNQDIPAP